MTNDNKCNHVWHQERMFVGYWCEKCGLRMTGVEALELGLLEEIERDLKRNKK